MSPTLPTPEERLARLRQAVDGLRTCAPKLIELGMPAVRIEAARMRLEVAAYCLGKQIEETRA